MISLRLVTSNVRRCRRIMSVTLGSLTPLALLTWPGT